MPGKGGTAPSRAEASAVLANLLPAQRDELLLDMLQRDAAAWRDATAQACRAQAKAPQLLELPTHIQERILGAIDAAAVALAELLGNLRLIKGNWTAAVKGRLTAAMVCRQWRDLLNRPQLWADIQAIQVLFGEQFPRFSDAAALALARRCTQARALNLGYVQQLTDRAIVGAVKILGPRLTIININGCCGLTDESLVAVGRSCQNLQRLDTAGNEDDEPMALMADRGLCAIADGCHSIVEFNASFEGYESDNPDPYNQPGPAFPHSTDVGALRLLGLPHLHTFGIRGWNISREILPLVRLHPTLKKLRVSDDDINCPITEADREDIRAAKGKEFKI